MHTFATLVVVLNLLPIVVLSTNSFYTVIQGQALEGWSYELKNISRVNCLLECSHKSDCLSVNYNQKDRVCQISKQILEEASVENNVIQKPEFCYIERCFMRDCSTILQNNPSAVSGEYVIHHTCDGRPEFTVYCDMRHDAGWTVIQRRQDGSVDFYRNWAEYKEGFGNVNTEFWLGNEQINRLTADGSFELLIEMTDHLDDMKFARYSHFRVDTEDSNYALKISGYTGTAGDSLAFHNGQQFTTKDRNNDKHSGNCAEIRKGGWWYYSCYGPSNLNGLYLTPGTADWSGIIWYHFHKYNSLKKTVMMVKRAP
ncbi:fibrinogen-like protein A isoform X1 [Antedon mediterranea]|uniref:fibrinogen-like protein A isoform X1 n=1 Tax=Antedon mediterranea TaxID=105859 RepID=UPI003AF9E635